MAINSISEGMEASAVLTDTEQRAVDIVMACSVIVSRYGRITLLDPDPRGPGHKILDVYGGTVDTVVVEAVNHVNQLSGEVRKQCVESVQKQLRPIPGYGNVIVVVPLEMGD